MNKLSKILTAFFIASLLSSCSLQKTENLSYLKESKDLVESMPKLDVYTYKKQQDNPVSIFIHRGYWETGDKDTFRLLGRNFARKNVVTVIADYTVSPNGNYDTMAKEVAAAVAWTQENVLTYGGNPKRIFLMGHSAGGHLISLVGTNPKYLQNSDVIKGMILNDAAGLDINSYLQKNPPTKAHNYAVTWTKNPKNCLDASPIYYISEKTPAEAIYVGTKTYPSIISENNDFVEKLNKFQPEVTLNYLNKKHLPMITQFAFPWNKR